VEATLKTISYFNIPDTSFTIELVGDGNLQQAINNDQDLPANTGFGIRLTEYFGNSPQNRNGYLFLYGFELDMVFNVASTVDTVIAAFNSNGELTNQRAFGNSILTPNSDFGGRINFKGYFREKLFWGLVSGFMVDFAGARLIWKDTVGTSEVSNLAYRFNLFHEFIPIKYRDKYSVNVSAGVHARNIAGDLRANPELQNRILGTNKRFFMGPNISVQARFKDIKAELTNSWLFVGDDQNSVNGLTQNQLIVSITYTGGFAVQL
jgi:hypothetical protein